MDYSNKTYYEILGVDKNASKEDIERAKNKLKFGAPENRVPFEMYKIIDEAYDTLSNAKSRKKYDESLKSINETLETNAEEIEKNDNSLEAIDGIDNIDDDIKIYEPQFKTSKLNTQVGELNNKLTLLEQEYDDIVQKLMNCNYEYDENNQLKDIQKLKEYYKQIVNVYDEIEEICKKLNITIPVESINDVFKKIQYQNKIKKQKASKNENNQEVTKENENEKLKQLEKKYLANISKLIELIDLSEDNNSKEWESLLNETYNLYDEIESLNKKLNLKTKVDSVDDIIADHKRNEEKNLEQPEQHYDLNIPNNIDIIQSFSDEQTNQELEQLKEQYYQTVGQVVKLIEESSNNSTDTYNKANELYNTAYNLYDEIESLSKNLNLENNVDSVDDMLSYYLKNKTNQTSKLGNEIFEDIKYKDKIGKKISPYENAKGFFEDKQNRKKVIFTALGVGLGFFVVGPVIFTPSIIANSISAVATGIISKKLVDRFQKKEHFKLSKTEYKEIVGKIYTDESKIINKSNEELRQKIESLCEHPNNNFELSKLKLKYENQVKLLGQIIDLRKQTIIKKGDFTRQSLKLNALTSEYREAKAALYEINKKIERKNLIREIGSENVKINSFMYNSLALGNLLLKRKLKLQKKRLGKVARTINSYEELEEEERHISR